MSSSEIDGTAEMSGVHQANLLRLPAVDDNPSARQLACRVASIFNDSRASMKLTAAWLARQPVCTGYLGPFEQDELDHELSNYFGSSSNESFVKDRSLAELRALTSAKLPPAIRNTDFRAFCDALVRVKIATSHGPPEFRVHEVRTAPDRKGQCVAYPAASHIPEQLERIHEHWTGHVADEPGWAGLVAMAAVLNLHPFADGNGRVARVLFNWTLNQGREDRLYLPLYELAALSRGGYLIRLRQAQYQSQWEPLALLHCLCAERLFS